MSLSASYVSSTQFTVATDKTSDFNPGRALRLDCGADGIKYGYVSYSSYSSPNTTVYLDSTESQAITENLATVDFSRVLSKETGGNLPLQVVWMNRGFKSGLTLSYKDADEIYIDSGALHIDNGTAENIYCAQSQITKQLTSLSASTWYGIYVDPPANGLSLVADDIEYSSTMPTYDQAKRGWYHPSTTDLRCIGFVYSNASSQIGPFKQQGTEWIFTDSNLEFLTAATPSNTFTDATANLPIGSIVGIIRLSINYTNAGSVFYTRRNGSAAAGVQRLYVNSTSTASVGQFRIDVDANKIFEYAFGVATTGTVYAFVNGFVLPDGM